MRLPNHPLPPPRRLSQRAPRLSGLCVGRKGMKGLVGLALAFPLVAVANPPAKCLDFLAYTVAGPIGGPYVAPVLEKSNPAHRFRTVIREGANAPPDFAGHLRVVTWGCGSPCLSLALVDRKSGKVWLMADKAAALGFEHHADSRLLVADPPSLTAEGWPPGVESISYVWNEATQSLDVVPGCNGYARQRVPADVGSASAPADAGRR